MRRSTTHLRQASKLLSRSRTRRHPPKPATTWEYHFRAMLLAFDTPWTQAAHVRHSQPPRLYQCNRSLRKLSTATAIVARKPLPSEQEDMPLHQLLPVFDLTQHITLSHLDRAVRERRAESAWQLFKTLVDRKESPVYVPLALCSGLYSVLTYARTLAGQGPSEYRQKQIEQLLQYVEQEYDVPQHQFIPMCEVIEVAPYKLLRQALRQNDCELAWSVYRQMLENGPMDDVKKLTRNTYFQLMALVYKDPDLSWEEKKRRARLIAKTHAGTEEYNRRLTANEILLIGKIYSLYRNGPKIFGQEKVTKLEMLSSDALAELVWRLTEFSDAERAYVLVNRVYENRRLQGDQFTTADEPAYLNLANELREQRQYAKALGYLEVMLKAGIPLSLRSYNLMIRIFADQASENPRYAEKAQLIYESMIDLGISPDIATYSEVMKAHAATGDLKKVVYLYYKMLESNIQPNVYTFSILINGFSKLGDARNVIRWFQTMMKHDVEPNEVIITCAMKAFRPRKREHQDIGKVAERIAKEAIGAGVKADTALYTILLRMQAELHGLRGALSVHQEMLDKHVEANAYTYTSLIYVCGKNQVPDTAQKIFELMKRSRRHLPNTVTYCALMDAWSRARRPDMIKMVVDEFLKELRANDHGGRLWIDAKIQAFVDNATL